ncbi:conjugal transfer protein TraN [Aliivibrio fischeri]|uniref:conjugal transfer protein TraN n=1 Tax=Aliivibrio fischeri TaxID=668 RepID=UPI0018C7D34B|nr:conjugal transfer protein TraN [Aliivibrio fischeri]
MLYTIRHIIGTYLTMFVFLLQSIVSVGNSYRAIGVAVSSYRLASGYAVSTGLSSTALLSSLLLAKPTVANAAKLEPPQAKCKDGYVANGGQCTKLDVTPIRVSCPSGYSNRKIQEPATGQFFDTCIKTEIENSTPVCKTNETVGGQFNQQCRTEEQPNSYGLCDDDKKDLVDGKCVTKWKTPKDFLCPNDGGASNYCPSTPPPAGMSCIPQIGGECSQGGADKGLCSLGEVIYMTPPNVKWSHLPKPAEGTPYQCTRDLYEARNTFCPTPNSSSPSSSQPSWATPSGIYGEDDRFYDKDTGNPTHCLRTWIEDYVMVCAEGTSYNKELNACENIESVTCEEGYTYRYGQCIGIEQGDVKCPSTHILSGSVCVPKPPESGHTFESAYNAGGDIGWAVGGLQSTKKSSGNTNGEINLDMGLVNNDANTKLQNNAVINQKISSTGTFDQLHNSYSDISNTFESEKNTNRAIAENDASYKAYLSSEDKNKTWNSPAEAYGLVNDTIEKNRPMPIDPDSDFLESSSSTIEGLGNGSDPFFGDCLDPNKTQTVLNPDKQVFTEVSCNEPNTKTFESCKVDRFVLKPTLRITEGAEDSKVEIIDSRTIRLTIGKMCDNCLSQRPGEGCSTYTDNVKIALDHGIGISKAEFTSAIWDDMISVTADGHEVFRRAHGHWANSGWPSIHDSCERRRSDSWNGVEDVTTQFKEAIKDSEIVFNYKVAVGGGGEGRASVTLYFDQDIRTNWEDKRIYSPEGCIDRVESSSCSTSGWKCDLQMGGEDKNFGHVNISKEPSGSRGYGMPGNIGDVLYLVAKKHFDPSNSQCGMVVSTTWNDGDGNNDDGIFICGDRIGQVTHQDADRQIRGRSLNEIIPGKSEWSLFAIRTAPAGPTMYKLNDDGSLNKMPYKVLNPGRYDSMKHSGYRLGRATKGGFDWPLGGNKDLWFSYWEVHDDKTDADVLLRLNNIKNNQGWIEFGPLWDDDIKNTPPKWYADTLSPTCMRAHATDFICDPLKGGTIQDANGTQWEYDDITNFKGTCNDVRKDPNCHWSSTECEEGFEIEYTTDYEDVITKSCTVERVLTAPESKDGYWTEEFVYAPLGCEQLATDESCTNDGWVCDNARPDGFLAPFPELSSGEIAKLPKYKLDFPSWRKWDSAGNWIIYNNGWSVKQTVNTSQMTVYGSNTVQGYNIYIGDITVKDSGDDDTIGIIFGYPEKPVWNNDPNDPNSHYYVLAWTANHSGANSSTDGLSLYKSFEPYLNHKAINFQSDTAKQKIIDNIPNFQWVKNQRYKFEIHFSHDLIKVRINGVDKLESRTKQGTYHVGKIGFLGHSQDNGHYENMSKVYENDINPDDLHEYPGFDEIGNTDNVFKPLFPGAPSKPACMLGHLANTKCEPRHENVIKEKCLMEKQVYSCVDNSNAYEEITVPNDMCGTLPCSNGECELRGDETNPDFAQAVVQIGTLNEIRNQMECSDPDDVNSCTVFSGKVRSCSYDQFGMIDCCEEYKSKTIDLFRLATNMMSVASFAEETYDISGSTSSMLFGEKGEGGWIPDDFLGAESFTKGFATSVNTFYDDTTESISDGWSAMTESTTTWFSTPTTNASGTNIETEPAVAAPDGGSTGDLFVDLAVDAVKNEVIDQLKEMASQFITDLLDELLQSAMVEAVKGAASSAASAMAGALGTAMAFMGAVGAIYAAAQIAMMLYQMLNGCEEEQQDMPQTLKEKKCFYSHEKGCDKKFGICQRKYEKFYCCFASLLSRLIVEQAITQKQVFGGRAYTMNQWLKEQGCRGLKLTEVGLVDFSKINMDEWYDLMMQSGSLPDGNETLEEMTQGKSYVNPFGREDALTVQKERGAEKYNEKYVKPLDKKDILSEVDCSKTPNVQGCEVGIFRN